MPKFDEHANIQTPSTKAFTKSMQRKVVYRKVRFIIVIVRPYTIATINFL